MTFLRPMLMMLALATGPVSATSHPKTVTVAKGETLASIAKRELGDPAAASELAALNGLAAGKEPKKNATLVIPGLERTRAVVAIREARSAGRDTAKAQEAMRGARYTEAESIARGGDKVRFSVTVDPKHESRFVVKDGELMVTAGGKTQTASQGSSVRATSGGAPKVVRAPNAPALREPRDGAVIADAGASLSWLPAKGARGYQVDVAKDLAFHDRIASLPVAETSLVLPPGLPKGTYFWRVSAIGKDGAESVFAGPRTFALTREPKGSSTDWAWGPIWDPWGEGPK